MKCREGCGACCIEPSITRPFYGMPHGKPAGVRCVHLGDDLRCGLFGDARRPAACGDFQAEPSACGSNRDEALVILREMETLTAATG